MVEGIFVVLDHKAQQVGMEKFNKLAKLGIFGNGKDAALVLANVPFALIGGIAALHITGVNFSISAGIVFIALLGICIQNGIVLITVFKENLRKKLSLAESLRLGVASPVRPVVMTALMAMIGLFPAALSNGIGSETQKPLAIVVIGGLVTATVLTLLIFPLIFAFFYREMHHDGPAPKRVSEERPVLVGA
jgi:cobalt-zinc-cadmium resistance protein CzcA